VTLDVPAERQWTSPGLSRAAHQLQQRNATYSPTYCTLHTHHDNRSNSSRKQPYFLSFIS